MSDEIKTSEELEEQFSIKSINVLFLDISSTCTGYAVANIDFSTKKVTWKSTGALWLNPKWPHQEKYLYMHEAIVNYFWIVEAIDYCVVEQYSINPKKMAGIHVVPEMQGAIKAAAAQHGVTVDSILPQTWRSRLGIKKKKLPNGKSDYKVPTMERIADFVEIPEQSTSNITQKDRRTPSDVYDALGVGLGWLIKLGFSTGDFSDIQFNPHIGFNIGEKN